MRMKVLVLMLAIFIGVVGACYAVDVPSPGIKIHGTLGEMYGKIGFDDNGNKFRYVLNGAGTNEYAGQPAFYDRAETNDYTVGQYLSTASLEGFAGIWHCDDDGDTTIADGYYGWIQISGVRTAYVSTEGTAIVLSDVLIGSVEAAPASDAAGQSFLARGRAAVTSSSTSSAYAGLSWPKAKSAVAVNTAAALVRIELRSEY